MTAQQTTAFSAPPVSKPPLPFPVCAPFLAALFCAAHSALALQFCLGGIGATAGLCLLIFGRRRNVRLITVLCLSAAAGFLWSALRLTVLSPLPDLQKLLSPLLSPWQTALGGLLRERIGGENGSLVCAMLLGLRDGITPETREVFSRLGISHLLAISGLHLSVLSGSLFRLLCLLRVPRRAACMTSAAFAVLFCALCGFPYSLVRAMLMYVLYCGAIIAGRDPSSVDALCFAGALICLCSPSAVTALSFQMSFTATLGIVCFSTPLTDELTEPLPRGTKRFLAYPVGLFVSTFCANLFLVILCTVELGEIAPAGFLVNFWFIPFSTVFLYFAALSLLFFPLPFLGIAAARITGWLAGILLHTARAFDRSIGYCVSMREEFVPFLCLAFCGGIGFACTRGRKTVLIFVFCAVCLLYAVCAALLIL